ITAQNGGENTEEDIKKEFLKSHFTGHLIGIGRMVEETFGEGSFRLLGMMKEKEGALQTMDWLKKARIRIKKD
ncbi:MAG: hypothetical protein ABI778_02805, partial [Ignavibacteriota bacterium]